LKEISMTRIILILAAVLMAVPAAAQELRWVAPVLDAPTTVALGDGVTTTKLDPEKDYIVKLPATTKRGSTVLIGGRNVVIVGGEITVPAGDPFQRGLYIKDATGTVHVEGVHFDMSGAESDAIVIAAPLATVQIQVVRVDGVHGWYRSWHADVIQPWGGVKRLLVDQLTAVTRYQGIQLSALTGPIGEIVLSRINLIGSGSQVWGAGKLGGNGGFLFWAECSLTASVTLDDAYLQPRKVRGSALAVYPDRSTKCPSAVSADGKSVTFPDLPIKGHFVIGKRRGGDFVGKSAAGLGYRK
jgi:hypothetical protein